MSMILSQELSSVSASNINKASTSRRLFGAWRRRSDATELFDYDDYNEEGGDGDMDISNSSRGRSSSALKRSLVRRWTGRSHSTGRAGSSHGGATGSQRSGSAERPRSCSTGRQAQRRVGDQDLPATPSLLATPAAPLATPAVLMASYDSAKGRLPPSASARHKTPYQERMAYNAKAARPTPVNLATLKRDLQKQRITAQVVPEDSHPSAVRQEQAPPPQAGRRQQQRQRRSTMPGPSPHQAQVQQQQQQQPAPTSQNKVMRRASQGQQQQQQATLHQPPRRLTSFLDPEQENNMQSQHAADKRLVQTNKEPTAVFQQPHTTAPPPAAAAASTTSNRIRSQQRSPMMQARLDRRLQSAHAASQAAVSSTKLYEMPNGTNFSSSVVPPIAEHPTPNSYSYDNDAASTSWEEDSVMSAGRIDLLVPSVRRSSASTARVSSPHRGYGGGGAGADKQQLMLDNSSSSWHSRGSDDNSSVQSGGHSPTKSHRPINSTSNNNNKVPSPQSQADDMDSPYDDDDMVDHSGDQFLMMDMDVVDALPRSFPRARKIYQQQQQHRHRVQLPEYYRSYNFSDDPSAIQPKIRKREPGDLRDGSSLMSSTSRTSLCSVSTSRSPFSVRSASAASCMTSSTQGSTQSAATAPPNLWEVDRHMHKKKRNVETHTDFVKFVIDPDENPLLKAQSVVLTTGGSKDSPSASSPWKGEAKGVPHKVSISFRRLTLRTQVRELKELLEDDVPSKMTTSSTVPPTPPFFHRRASVDHVVTREDLQLESTSKKAKRKKGKASIRASI